jgi:hypothetical protein
VNRPGSLFRIDADRRERLRRAGVLTGVGILGLIPAMILVGAGVLDQQVPPALVHPVLVMGGLAVALAASFVAVTHWEVRNGSGILRVVCTIRKRPADLLVLGTALLLLATITVYLFVENYQPR